jgi:cell division protein FtsW (lipid II flippase)
MRLLQPETLRLRGWAPKAGWLAWRNYDFQLTTYAVLLTLFGLAMAYSNTVGINHAPVTLNSPFVRTIMWAVIAAVGVVAQRALARRADNHRRDADG